MQKAGGCRGVSLQERHALAGIGEPASAFIEVVAIETFDGDGKEPGRWGRAGKFGEVAAEYACDELASLAIGVLQRGIEGGVGGDGDFGIGGGEELAEGVGGLPAIPLPRIVAEA